MPAPDPATYLALRRATEAYASGIDRRDTALFLSAFEPDGKLHIHYPATGEAMSLMTGHDELSRVTEVIQRYAQTCHFLGQSTFDVTGDEAIGETYCLAHHLSPGLHGGDNLVMHIRYDEHLRRSADGTWRFTDRAVLIDWMDRRVAMVVGAW
jgi:hypothetical protein